MKDISKYIEGKGLIWDFFLNLGFSEEGTAAFMGNLYAESSLLPNVLERLCIQRYKEKGVEWDDESYTAAVDSGRISRDEFITPMGKHYGYGIVQWTDSIRKAAFYDFMRKRDVSIGDLGSQLDFIYIELTKSFPKVFNAIFHASDIHSASDFVLYNYERPAHAEDYSEIRADYGRQIYEMYRKRGTMTFTENEVVIVGHGSGTPSKKNLNDYNSMRYYLKAANGVRKGVVAVRRLKTLREADRAKFHDKYKTILGRNIYSQSLRDYCYKRYKDESYYSDCSSSIILTFKELGYSFPSVLNTAGIYQSSLFSDVRANIANGHILNPEVLEVGDCILYAGNDPSRPKQIGHVEAVYELPSSSYASYDISTGSKGLQITASGTLNVRSGPGTEYRSIGSIDGGSFVYPTKKAFAINKIRWYYVPSLLGWVSGNYLTGWVKESDGRWWYALPEDRWYASAVKCIDGEAYIFGEDGYLITGSDITVYVNLEGAVRYKGA